MRSRSAGDEDPRRSSAAASVKRSPTLAPVRRERDHPPVGGVAVDGQRHVALDRLRGRAARPARRGGVAAAGRATPGVGRRARCGSAPRCTARPWGRAARRGGSCAARARGAGRRPGRSALTGSGAAHRPSRVGRPSVVANGQPVVVAERRRPGRPRGRPPRGPGPAVASAWSRTRPIGRSRSPPGHLPAAVGDARGQREDADEHGERGRRRHRLAPAEAVARQVDLEGGHAERGGQREPGPGRGDQHLGRAAGAPGASPPGRPRRAPTRPRATNQARTAHSKRQPRPMSMGRAAAISRA